MKEAILKLKNLVKQYSAGGSALREKIRQAKGLERYQLWNEKRWHGDDTRLILLAYACLQERPYLTVERKVHQGNEPSATTIHHWLEQALDDTQKAAWSRERVKAWLDETPPVAQEAA